MRSKHLSVRKCIDKKPDKIKGIVCICIILAVVCAGNMIPNYLISLKAAKIAKTSTTISNADISPYSHSISAEERLTKMMSLMQDNVNELWNGKYSEKREPLDTEIPVRQAYTAIQTFLKGACELQKQSGIMQMLGEDDIVMLQSLESNYSKDTDSETEQTYEAAPWQYGAAVTLDDSIDNTISDYFVTSDISKELSAWIFIISFEDTRMLAAVDAVLGVPFYITYYCADVDSPKAQAAVMRDLYAKIYGSDYSMGDPKESESKIDSSFETNIIENFYYGNNYTQGDDEYTGYLVDNSAPFAVADKNGTILTDFDYQDACMAGESLIAVKDAAGNWGYCDQSGALVIPCIYQPQMSLSIMNETVEYPYADLSGMVVVKNQSGQKLVLDVYGNEIISAGQYEDLAPARDGCVWAKQNGLWGLLQVQDYTENNADIILPDGCVAPDVTLSRIDSLCTYTTADHGLVMRKGPGTNYEKMDNIPYGIIVWECGYSSNVPDWVVVYLSLIHI